MELKIRLIWDADARVWVAESDGIPGLVMESGSFDALVERLRYAGVKRRAPRPHADAFHI